MEFSSFCANFAVLIIEFNLAMNNIDKKTILFSRTVKAGRRVYYIDVKQDRRGQYYLSFTESKRVQDGTEIVPPVLEKHKIFLYQEDFQKFQEAFNAALDYVKEQQVPDSIESLDSRENTESEATPLSDDAFSLNVDFE